MRKIAISDQYLAKALNNRAAMFHTFDGTPVASDRYLLNLIANKAKLNPKFNNLMLDPQVSFNHGRYAGTMGGKVVFDARTGKYIPFNKTMQRTKDYLTLNNYAVPLLDVDRMKAGGPVVTTTPEAKRLLDQKYFLKAHPQYVSAKPLLTQQQLKNAQDLIKRQVTHKGGIAVNSPVILEPQAAQAAVEKQKVVKQLVKTVLQPKSTQIIKPTGFIPGTGRASQVIDAVPKTSYKYGITPQKQRIIDAGIERLGGQVSKGGLQTAAQKAMTNAASTVADTVADTAGTVAKTPWYQSTGAWIKNNKLKAGGAFSLLAGGIIAGQQLWRRNSNAKEKQAAEEAAKKALQQKLKNQGHLGAATGAGTGAGLGYLLSSALTNNSTYRLLSALAGGVGGGVGGYYLGKNWDSLFDKKKAIG